MASQLCSFSIFIIWLNDQFLISDFYLKCLNYSDYNIKPLHSKKNVSVIMSFKVFMGFEAYYTDFYNVYK